MGNRGEKRGSSASLFSPFTLTCFTLLTMPSPLPSSCLLCLPSLTILSPNPLFPLVLKFSPHPTYSLFPHSRAKQLSPLLCSPHLTHPTLPQPVITPHPPFPQFPLFPSVYIFFYLFSPQLICFPLTSPHSYLSPSLLLSLSLPFFTLLSPSVINFHSLHDFHSPVFSPYSFPLMTSPLHSPSLLHPLPSPCSPQMPIRTSYHRFLSSLSSPLSPSTPLPSSLPSAKHN